jgi:hypothetical protein
MLHDIYLHEMLASTATTASKREIANLRALAALPRRPGIVRRVARRSGRVFIRVGAWLMAYGADRSRPYAAPTSFSQN